MYHLRWKQLIGRVIKNLLKRAHYSLHTRDFVIGSSTDACAFSFPQALESLPLPFTVTAGTVGRLELQARHTTAFLPRICLLRGRHFCVSTNLTVKALPEDAA